MNDTDRPAPIAAVLALAAAVLWTPRPGAAQTLPIFDTHMHYSAGAWADHGPEAVIEALDAANVPRALVSSTPDDGTLRLYREDAGRFVPIMRPYRSRGDLSVWTHDASVTEYVAGRLESGVYGGIGEFHLFDERDAASPQVMKIAAMAVKRDIVLHIHSGAAPVGTLLATVPNLRILWAHAGMSAPPAVIGEMLDRHPRLVTEISFRAGDIAPNGALDAAWRALLVRHRGRFMVGTDTYLSSRWDVYGELIDAHRRWLAQLPRDVAEAIAFRNAVRLFGAGGQKTLQ